MPRTKTATATMPEGFIDVDKVDVAEWMRLSTPDLLGQGSLRIHSVTAAKLRERGPEAELTTAETGRILGITRQQVTRYCSEEDRAIRLGHRRRLGIQILIPAAELAAFIEAKNTAGPVPLKRADRKRYEREVNRIASDTRRRHNLPRSGVPA